MKKIYAIAAVAIIGLTVSSVAFGLPLAARLDFVNIGDPASEAGHNLQGWGPAEPAANGGNWGQIGDDASGADCDLPAGQLCDAAARVAYAASEPDHPQITGRMASVTFEQPKKGWQLATELKIRALDGMANDDFMVFVKNKKGNWENIYTYVSDPGTAEVWKVHTITLSPRHWFDKSLEVAVMSTGSNWSMFSPYGQLGIDWMELAGYSGTCNKPACHDCED
jgi:hypothetical protein